MIWEKRAYYLKEPANGKQPLKGTFLELLVLSKVVSFVGESSLYNPQTVEFVIYTYVYKTFLFVV